MDELDAATDLGPENEEQLARLRRALILGDGFQIVLVELSHPHLAKEVALLAGDPALARDVFRHVAEIAEVLADGELAAAARLGLARAGGANEDAGGRA